MQVVWCNAHTLWVLGPVTLWIVVVAEWIEARATSAGLLVARHDTLRGARLRTLTVVAALSSAASLANPYFLQGVAFPFGLFREISAGHMFSESIAEFRSPFSDYFLAADFRTVALVVAIVVFLLFGKFAGEFTERET